jgi:hypothetical protein
MSNIIINKNICVDAFSGQHTRALDRAERRKAELAELLPGQVWPVRGTGLTGVRRRTVKT